MKLASAAATASQCPQALVRLPPSSRTAAPSRGRAIMSQA
ncbi:hypothetical protein ABH917_004562 [Thermobifida halotolerans]